MMSRDQMLFDKKDLQAKDPVPILDYVGFMSTGRDHSEICLDNLSIREVDVSAEDDE